MSFRMKRALKWLLLVVFGFILIIVLGTLTLRISPSLQIKVLKLVLKNQPIEIKYKKLYGSLFETIELVDLSITYTENGNLLVAHADTFRATYKAIDFLRHRYNFRSVHIAYPRVTYRSLYKSGEKKQPKENILTGLPCIGIDNLIVRDGNLSFGEEIKEIYFEGALYVSAERLVLQIDSAGARIPSRGRIVSLQGNAEYSGNKIAGHFELKPLSSDWIVLDLELTNLKPIMCRLKISTDNLVMSEIDSLLGTQGTLTGQGRVKCDVLVISNIFKGSAFVDGEFFGIKMKTTSANFKYANGLLELAELKGNAFGGDITGDIKLWLNKTPLQYSAKAYVENFNLAVLAGKDFKTNLKGNVVVKGSGTTPEEMILEISYSSASGKFLSFDIDSSSGSLRITPDSLRFYSPTYAYYKSVYLSCSGFQSGKKEIRIEFNIRGSITDIAPLLNLPPITGELKVSGNIGGNPKNPFIEGSLKISKASYSNLGAESINSEFLVRNISKNPQIEADIHAKSVRYSKFTFDSLFAKASGTRSKVSFYPFTLWGDSLFLVATGSYDTTNGLLLSSAHGRFLDKDFSIDREFQMKLTKEAINFSALNLNILGGTVYISPGRYEHNIFQGSGRFQKISLKEIADFLKTKYKISGELGGEFGIAVDKSGEIGGQLWFEVSSPVLGGVPVEMLSGGITLQGKDLFIDSLRIKSSEESYTLTGGVHNFGESLDILIKANGTKNSFLPGFVKGIDDFSGTYDVSLRIRGSKNAPHISGSLNLKNGTLALSALNDPLTNIMLQAESNLDTLKILKFSGELHTTPIRKRDLWYFLKRLVFSEKEKIGTISGTGYITLSGLKPYLSLRMNLKGLPLKFMEQGIFLVLSGELLASGYPPFALSGELQVETANILSLGQSASGGESGEIVLPTDLNIIVDIPGNFWILTNNIEAELDGSLSLNTYNRVLNISGKMDVVSGKYFGFGNVFKIDRGELIFTGIEKVNPQIDINAHTFVGNKEIRIAISGKLNEPNLTLSTPGEKYTQEDILFLLALSRPAEADTSALASRLETRTRLFLEQYAKTQIENVARQTLGVESFELTLPQSGLEDGINGIKETQISMGKYLTDKLYLQYSRPILSDTLGSKLKLEYRVNKYLNLEGTRTSQGDMQLNIKWEINF